MYKIYVIGVDSYGINDEKRRVLCSTELIISSGRFEKIVENLHIPVEPISPLHKSLKVIEEQITSSHVSVLASGDPLFYGIAARLIQQFGSERVEVLPALSSLQEAAAKFTLDWHDAKIVSLHGRKSDHLPSIFLHTQKCFAFTDKAHAPNVIATKILDYLQLIGQETDEFDFQIFVAENIGMEDERVVQGQLEEIAGMEFSPLNIMATVFGKYSPRHSFGCSEDEISHSRGLITKSEVRAATLHSLRLPITGVFWDIGGGSGSISIEAALLQPGLTIYTVEHKAEELENIRANIRKFNCFNIIPVAGRAKECIETLPPPDTVFVGGSGGELKEIIQTSVNKLVAGGRLVINGVIDKTVQTAPPLMKENGLTVTTSRIEVGRNSESGELNFNPITIMVGQK